MKNLTSSHKNCLYIIVLLCIISTSGIFAQVVPQDSIYLPPIKIVSANGYGPYVIGTKRSNVFIAYELPTKTSKIIFRFIDSKGIQIGKSYTKEGSNLAEAIWNVESDTMGFPLSPQLSVEVHYQTDSIAIYNIPYTVYPDTVKFFATEGWGPFITNSYPLSDTSWQPVPALYNTFTVKNLPPRTDTLEFQILTADSTVIDSIFVYAPSGEYLDSAVYSNVRMDSLPLTTRFLRTLIWSEGGPDKGLEFHKELSVIPQKPKLISKSEGVTLYDSIGVFVQNQIGGNALLVDSTKHAVITNGPGELLWSRNSPYAGPYSFDVIKNSFTIEAWLKFDLEIIHLGGEAIIGSVDRVWQLALMYTIDVAGGYHLYIYFTSLAEGLNYNLFTIDYYLPVEEFQRSEWHHIAFVQCMGRDNQYYPTGNFYLDGKQLPGTTFNYNNYNHIKYHTNYMSDLKTEPLFLSALAMSKPGTDFGFSDYLVIAMDEVRIWNRHLTAEEIKNNYKKTLLQDISLVGYWNFNDLRNRLGTISDISYKNNSGQLKNGAAFIPQYPQLQVTMDTFEVISSNALCDSMVFSFIDLNNKIIDSDTLQTDYGKDTLLYDVSALPYDISHLRISEYYPGATDSGFVTCYKLQGLASPPIATPQYNWNTIIACTGNTNLLFTPITVSNLPENTKKVKLGLRKEDNYYDTTVYTNNTVPYGYSLTLNGTDNYIETSQQINSPENFTIMFWFKTTTKMGGKIIGFTQNQNGITTDYYDRGIYMETDGSIRFRIDMGGQIHFLYGSSIYNDGEWHHVAVAVDNSNGAGLFVDGCLVDRISTSNTFNYQGYWVIGRSNVNKTSPEFPIISEFFQGSLSEISIWNSILDYNSINSLRFISIDTSAQTLHYKLNEGSGTEIHDSQGNNDGELKGTSQKWQLTNALSFITWNASLLDKEPGTYTFFAKVYYPGGPDEGAYYPLGNFYMPGFLDPYYFIVAMSEGNGYFNEGVIVYNMLAYNTDFDASSAYDWNNNYVTYSFLSPDHQVISSETFTYTTTPVICYYNLDMGDAPPGSYLHFEFGWNNTSGISVYLYQLSFPVYIKPMIPPQVSGDFGPFDQAIAPNVMKKENTFIITTEPLSDLNKIVGRFYNNKDQEIAATEAVKINETTWHLTYDMATLAPPITQLKFEYYLGTGEFLALIQGPFKITIHKTRPDWFDFIPDDDFHDVQQNGNEVTFSIDTPFEVSYWVSTNEIDIPDWIMIWGGTHSEIDSPWAKAYLKYNIPEYKLELDQPPEFYQSVQEIAAGSPKYLRFSFNQSQNNSYFIDPLNNLIATQNFSIGGTVTSRSLKIDKIIYKTKDMINAAGAVEPGSIIIQPAFEIKVKGGFEYASRLHLITDNVSGGWGSFGNLDIDANPDHTQAFKNSASYHFYSVSLSMEFDVGVKFFKGLVGVYFGVEGRTVVGFGHSYITIPENKTKPLKSGAFQVYGRVFVSALWGWYETTVWGPDMFYSHTFWGDDMSHCYPPAGKIDPYTEYIAANSSWPELTNRIKPVSKFSKMPLPYPQPSVATSVYYKQFTWIERGKSYGERRLRARYLSKETRKFSDKLTIEINNNAINDPVSDVISENTILFTWAQTRYTNETILKVKPDNVIKEFVEAQDIWYAVYDLEGDTLIQMNMIEDNTRSITSGRAEANPEVNVISESRALIIWQVADLEIDKSDIWYVLLEKQGDIWEASSPAVLAEIEGINTQLKIASPDEDMAVAVWLNTNGDDPLQNCIMTSVFNGNKWNEPTQLINNVDDQYYNYLDMKFNNGVGAIVWTTFVEDTVCNYHEKLKLLPWNPVNNQWSSETPITLLADSARHIQLPRIAIYNDGTTSIAVKIEEFVSKTENDRISQIDILTGDINNPTGDWNHIPANEYVCDTTKQVSDITLTYIAKDTLMILTNEYVMLATNAAFQPVNGIMFGDPYMNLVLRCFFVDDDGTVEDVDENIYFVDINEHQECTSNIMLYQNYPNPCKDFTTIRFDIPDGSHVLLELFDMNGFRTAVLADQKLMAGQYEVTLNTAVLKPGTYIYKLTTDDSISTLRMIVSR